MSSDTSAYVNPLKPNENKDIKLKHQNTAGFKQMAKHNAVDDVSVCVECGKQMRILECNGIPCYVCVEHRVCFPTQDA